MHLFIENKHIFTNGDKAIIKFDTRTSQEVKEDIIITPNLVDTIFDTSQNISFYFGDKKSHESFKKHMINTPVSSGAVNMYDYFSNNIGKYMPERKNNLNGGTISMVPERVNQISSVINRTSGNSVIFWKDYFPISNITSPEIALKYFNQDWNNISVDTKSLVIFVSKKVYDFLVKANCDFSKTRNFYLVPDKVNMSQFALEKIFGKVIPGRPSNISTFLKISGGKVDSVMAKQNGCSITNRSENRVQLISNSRESTGCVICFLSDVKGEISVDYDEKFKQPGFNGVFTDMMDVSVTPNLGVDFYHNLFELESLTSKLSKECTKEKFMEYGIQIMKFLLDGNVVVKSEFNSTEKMIVNFYKQLLELLNEKFYSVKNKNFTEKNTMRRSPFLEYPSFGCMMERQESCAMEV